MRSYVAASILFLSSTNIGHSKTFHYFGEARNKGQIIYNEFHEVTYDKNNKIISSKTEYKDPEGTLLSELESDYENSLTTPIHTVKDYTSQRTFGIRSENHELYMFHQIGNEKEKTKQLPSASSDEVTVAAQGLNYYIVENFDLLLDQKKIPIKFILPSNFDYFRIVLEHSKDPTDKTVEFTIKMKSFWLKIFAPTMTLRYDKAKKRILFFKGLSNIRDKNGNRQVVEINYSYKD